MKRILSMLLVLSLLLPCLALADEDVEELRAVAVLYHEDTPSRRITFTYPAKYDSRAEYSAASQCFFNVYYDDFQYVAVWLMPAHMERLRFFENNYGTHSSTKLKHSSPYTLNDQMCAAGIFSAERGLPCGSFDTLEIGITLDNGYFIIVQSNCFSGQVTGCYDLLLDILSSFVDTEPVEKWLTETWYPQVLAQEENAQ